MAVHAQIGHALEGIGLEQRGVELSGQDGPHQIGLGTRRGFFRRSDAKDRAHSFVVRLSSAGTASVAGSSGLRDFGGIPIQFQLNQMWTGLLWIGGSPRTVDDAR